MPDYLTKGKHKGDESNVKTLSYNNTGIPLPLKEKYENLSGFSFDDVRISYNSDRPDRLCALAYTEGNRVYIGPGQENCLEHELGHVVQQKQGQVKPNGYINGLPLNTDSQLESRADSFRNETVCLPELNYSSGAWSLSSGLGSYGETCIQAKWKKSKIFTGNIYENRKMASTLSYVGEAYKNISKMVDLVYNRDTGELYIDGEKVPYTDDKVKKELERDLESETQEGTVKEELPTVSEDAYPGLEFEIGYLKRLNQSLDVVRGIDIDSPDVITSDKLYAVIYEEALRRTKRYLYKRYLEAHEGVKNLRAYGRTGRTIYRDLLTDRNMYYKEYKDCFKPMQSFYEETEMEMRNMAVERITSEIKRVWNNIQYKKQFLLSKEKRTMIAIHGGIYDEKGFRKAVYEEALVRTKRYIWSKYQETCMGVLRLRTYGRTKGERYKELLAERTRLLNEGKNCTKPEQFYIDEVEQEWAAQSRMSVDFSDASQKQARTGKSYIEQTRENLLRQSLLVLPEGLPLAGIFPNQEAVYFEKGKRRESLFPELNKHADSLILKYRLHTGDGGIIEAESGCVCIMYLKERQGEGFLYKPAFGISGYFSGKGTEGVKTGFEAMGIPKDLLEAKDKPAALKAYLAQCSLLGLRRPSMQACLSYLQDAEIYDKVERWKPVICAEPAIVMAIHNLYPDTAELVLSYPYHGRLVDVSSHKSPVPKYTCARCALAEKSFGAAVISPDGKSIIRERVRMGIKNPHRLWQLFKEHFVRNPDREPLKSDGPAYYERKSIMETTKDENLWKHVQMQRFLRMCLDYKFYHGSKEFQNQPGTVFYEPGESHGQSGQQARAAFGSGVRPVTGGRQYAAGIADDQGRRIEIIDSPSSDNNCFFAALQSATGVAVDANNARRILRDTLNRQNIFMDGRMVGGRDLEALRALNQQTFSAIFRTTGFTVQVYGRTGLLQSTNYGTVTNQTPVIINLGFYHYVAKV